MKFMENINIMLQGHYFVKVGQWITLQWSVITIDLGLYLAPYLNEQQTDIVYI